MTNDDKKNAGSFTVSVLPIGPFDSAFTYSCDTDLKLGDVVEVPFGRRKAIGLVVDDEKKSDIELKQISTVFKYNIGEDYCAFLKWVSGYTLIPAGYVLRMILAERSVFSAKSCKKNDVSAATPVWDFSPIVLNENQCAAYENIKTNGNRPFLLHGVTGSGKTELYLAVAQEAIKNHKQVLILLPEIMLSNQLCERIERYFGCKPLIWNSNVTKKNRGDIWKKVYSGDSLIIIGTRSALFLPFANLGLIVVDEEHDSSYKQEERGFYNARDMAVVLGSIKKIPVVLSTATPSLESYVNAQGGKYGYSFVESRFGASRVAKIDFIDMRQCKFDGFLSPNLMDEIKKTIARKEQCLIYLNRRGYSPMTLCKSCGNKIACPNCACWLIYHKQRDVLMCHYCAHTSLPPRSCGACGDIDSHIQFGPGVERIFEELSAKIPNAKIQLASSDTISSDTDMSDLLEKIHSGDSDIIVGTQILAKGHHFPNLTLVGVVDGDLGLSNADLRSTEKMYQLISQVAGRAGRAEKSGKILIQTFSPDHSLYEILKTGKEKKFLTLEAEHRKESKLPPFVKFSAVIISGTNKELTEVAAYKLSKSCSFPGVRTLGAAPAPLFLLRGRARWRLLLISPKNLNISDVLRKWLSRQKIPRNIDVQVDIDPITFL